MPPMLAHALPCSKSTQHINRCEVKGNDRNEGGNLYLVTKSPADAGQDSHQKHFTSYAERISEFVASGNDRNMHTTFNILLKVNGSNSPKRPNPFCFKLSQSIGQSRRDEVVKNDIR
jgi:hypothetical protein